MYSTVTRVLVDGANLLSTKKYEENIEDVIPWEFLDPGRQRYGIWMCADRLSHENGRWDDADFAIALYFRCRLYSGRAGIDGYVPYPELGQPGTIRYSSLQ